ncbi:recombinase family protein [bacterium]|nr:recombinase family protein [bacterium]
MENKKVAIYCRVASKNRIEIKNQKEILKNYCNENNYEIYKIYIDNGYSGLDDNRPNYNKLLNDLKKNMFDTIIVRDMSRLGRSFIKLEKVIKLLENNNCNLICLNEDINSKDAVGKILLRCISLLPNMIGGENDE